jgi:hypothetical protein
VQPITPAEAGLALGSTLVSAHRKIAEINGKSYGLNERVQIVKDALDVSFRIVEIQPRRVVLERNGQLYELKIPRPLLDGIEDLAGRGSADEQPASATPAGAVPESRTGNSIDEDE